MGSVGHTVEKSARSREQSLFLPCILGAQVISETVAEADSPEHVPVGIRHKTQAVDQDARAECTSAIKGCLRGQLSRGVFERRFDGWSAA